MKRACIFGCLLLVVFFTACGGGGSNAPASDPCQGISEKGVCSSAAEVKWCEVVADSGRSLQTQTCADYESCQVVSGAASCITKEGQCIPGATQCAGNDVSTCDASGNWTNAACSNGCRNNPLGAFCSSTVATAPLSSALAYQYKDIDTTAMNNWSAVGQATAGGVIVESLRGSTVIDAAITDANGAFTINVPSPAQAGDTLAFFAVRPQVDMTQTGISMAFVRPNFPTAGNYKDVPATGTFWVWSADLTVPANPYLITIAQSSGVLREFDWLNQIMNIAVSAWPTVAPAPLAVWMQENVTWDCGACQWNDDVKVVSNKFKENIAAGMTTLDEGYWSRAVYGHEFGHYAMDVWGKSVGEAGPHCFGSHYPPGLAFSEGWATWFSSSVRNSPVYYDKIRGSFDTFNIADRTYSATTKAIWTRPTVKAGILQNMDENEVSAMMWTISRSSTSTPLYNALASPRLTGDSLFSQRGYKVRNWKTDPEDNCTAINITPSATQASMVADFFDAMICGGTQISVINAATEPTNYYPYYPNATQTCN